MAMGAPLLFSACATVAPPLPPSLELPKPPSDLRAVRKGDKVTLSWTIPTTTTDRQTVRTLGPTRICRGVEPQLTQCEVQVGEAPGQAVAASAKSSKQKPRAAYSDLLPAQVQSDGASAFLTYAVDVLNTDGRGAGLSNQVRVATIRTLRPPRDFDARVADQGVVLTWTNDLPAASQGGVHYVYRVYRRAEGSQQSILAGEIPAAGEHEITLTDSSIEWEKTYEYRAETVTVVDRGSEPALAVDGDDTVEVKVIAHDVFPPAVPSGLQAVFSGPGQKAFIDLVWAPVTDVDLDGYNVYRREEGSAVVKINPALLKAPAYRDDSVASGKRYLYSVTAVDVRGNESARSEEAEESVP